jgi:transposase
VEALRGLRVIDMISAATFIASTGDLSRFESPRLLMGYLGLVPSEHSSAIYCLLLGRPYRPHIKFPSSPRTG